MAITTTPETINGKTTRHTLAIYRAKLDALPVILGDWDNPLMPYWNQLIEHTDALIEFQRVQIQMLEALCRNQQAKAEARDTKFDPANHEYEDCGSHCVLHGKYGTSGRAW